MNITIGADAFDIQTLSSDILLHKAAIYTIWTFDSSIQKYPLLYVGETGDLEERIGPSHHKYQCWLNHANRGLFIGIWWMPTQIYSKEQREKEEQRLIQAYKPVCNN